MNLNRQAVACFTDGTIKSKCFYTDSGMRRWIKRQLKKDERAEVSIVCAGSYNTKTKDKV